MADLFSAAELIEVAIREEHTGATFYRALAEKTESAELKEFALQTAQMEVDHEAKFTALLDRLGVYKPAESYSGEYESYVSYLIEGRIFPMGEDAVEMATRMANDAEAVDQAMAMERNTLLFYGEMMKFVPESEHPLLEDIMDEERQHVTDFAKYRASHF